MIRELSYQIKRAKVLVQRYFKNNISPGEEKHSEITRASGTSFPFGKKETIEIIQKICPNKNSRVLDVGPGRGIYNKLLREKGYKNFDAVEIYLPYIKEFQLEILYDKVYHSDITDFQYDHYDIIIMGDVVEHLPVKAAQKVIKYAQDHSNLLMVAVPYKLKQIGSQLDGSGDHRQADLTREIFMERYPNFELLVDNHQLGVFYSRLKKS
jgi:phospholipid N-methyltransferase